MEYYLPELKNYSSGKKFFKVIVLSEDLLYNRRINYWISFLKDMKGTQKNEKIDLADKIRAFSYSMLAGIGIYNTLLPDLL